MRSRKAANSFYASRILFWLTIWWAGLNTKLALHIMDHFPEKIFLLSSKTRNNKWWWREGQDRAEAARFLEQRSGIYGIRAELSVCMLYKAAAARKSPCFSTFFGLFSFKHNLNVCVCTLLCIHWTLLKIERPFQLITHPSPSWDSKAAITIFCTKHWFSLYANSYSSNTLLKKNIASEVGNSYQFRVIPLLS